jgi:ribosomal protein S12
VTTSREQTSAEYQRRYRRRRREGRRVVPVEIDESIIEDALIRRGFLLAQDADDPKKLAAALREAVRQLITPPAEIKDTVMHNGVGFRVGP